MPYPWFPQAANFPAPQAPFMTPPPQHVPQTPPQQAAEQAQAPQPQANENVQANANAGPLFDDEEEEDNANRDWLDKIYTLCRIGILLSIFWFYSSTSRFLVLIITFVLIYLYQSGIFQFFRRGTFWQKLIFNVKSVIAIIITLHIFICTVCRIYIVFSHPVTVKSALPLPLDKVFD